MDRHFTKWYKILIDDDTWIDLDSGKSVDFAWHQKDEGFSSFASPIWSPDETRIYTCCYLYGDARTGQSFGIPYNDITVDGKEPQVRFGGNSLYNSFGTWVLNDRYLLSQWDHFYDMTPDFIPLFDPVTRTYLDLSKLAGIAPDFQGNPNCLVTSASNGGRYVWAECYDADHLVDLATFKSWAYPGLFQTSVQWSPDGQYASIFRDDDSPAQILDASKGELKPSPPFGFYSIWHPTDDVLSYLSNNGQSLSLLDARSMQIRQISLPRPFAYLVWSPTGEHLALLADDGSLWVSDYPSMGNPEQLTPARPGSIPAGPGRTQPRVRSITWSPDERSLSFIGNKDIYIVAVKSAP